MVMCFDLRRPLQVNKIVGIIVGHIDAHGVIMIRPRMNLCMLLSMQEKWYEKKLPKTRVFGCYLARKWVSDVQIASVNPPNVEMAASPYFVDRR